MSDSIHEPVACTNNVRRAPRFPIVAPVRFRAGVGEWLAATTVNISRLGLLLRTEYAPAPSTLLELRVAMAGDEEIAGPHVECTGRVLRLERVSGTRDSLVAVTIDRYQLRPAIDGRDGGVSDIW